MAKLSAAAVVLIGLLLTTNLTSVALVLGAELIALPWAGVPLSRLAFRAWPLLLAAIGVAAANLAASSGGWGGTVALSLRLLAISLPGVLVFATTDPVDLADSLTQQLHVPPRFAYSALAALRLLPLLSAEWSLIRRARRARGVDTGSSPVAALRLFLSAVFALFVSAIRQGTRLAAAMDARGFDAQRPRTSARHQRVTVADLALVTGTTLVVALSVALPALR